MSRSSFILAVALLVVAGSLTYMATFDRSNQGNAASANGDLANPANSTSDAIADAVADATRKRTRSDRRDSGRLQVPDSATSHLGKTELRQVESILAQTRREARAELDKLSRKYKLTPEQQKDIYPFVIAHHEDAHPAIMVNGSPIPAVSPGTTLEDSIAPILDDSQQDSLAEDAADHDAWWEEVVGQLEDDLDNAIDSGEMVAVTDDFGNTGVSVAESAAEGDGEESSHSGGNLFDLLGP